MSKCVLITSHLNLSKKCDAAHRLLDFLNDKGLPIILCGNHPILPELQKKANGVFTLGKILKWRDIHTFGEQAHI